LAKIIKDTKVKKIVYSLIGEDLTGKPQISKRAQKLTNKFDVWEVVSFS
jgi:hypothetical protein